MGLWAKRAGISAIVTIMAAALAAAPVHAGPSDTMTIRGTVTRACHLIALPMTFGTIGVFLPTADTQTSVLIDCTPSTAYSVAFDDGDNFNGQRRMARTGAGFGTYLNYEIYRNAARTQRWGRTAAEVVSGVAPANGKVTLTAYGRANGFIVAGPFQDTVTVTISF